MVKKYPRNIMYNKPPGRKQLDGSNPHEDAQDPTVFLQVKITKSLKESFAQKCKDGDSPMSEVIRQLIEEYLTR